MELKLDFLYVYIWKVHSIYYTYAHTHSIHSSYFFFSIKIPQNTTHIRVIPHTYIALYNLASVRMHIKYFLRILFRELANFFSVFTVNVIRASGTIRKNNATDARWHIRTVRFYRAMHISSRGPVRFTRVIRYDAGRIMSTWKNLCPRRLGSKVTSDV